MRLHVTSYGLRMFSGFLWITMSFGSHAVAVFTRWFGLYSAASYSLVMETIWRSLWNAEFLRNYWAFAICLISLFCRVCRFFSGFCRRAQSEICTRHYWKDTCLVQRIFVLRPRKFPFRRR